MGKTIKSIGNVVSAPIKTVGNVIKNPGQAIKQPGKLFGTISGGLTGAGLIGAGIGGKAGEVVDTAMGNIGGSLGAPGMSDPLAFDVSREAERVQKEYQRDLDPSRKAEGQARDASGRLLTALEAQATGKAPSIAEAQMRQTSDRNLAQQLAAAQAARGGNIAAQQRQLTQAQGVAGRQLAQDSAIARLQERNQAQQMLGSQALSQQQVSGTRAMDALSGVEQAIYAPKTARQQASLAQLGSDTQINLARRGERSSLVGGLLGGAGAIGGALVSDKNMKKDVKSAKGSTSKLLDALSSKKFKYKDDKKPGTAPGQRYGIMAQDLEKSEMGKSLVMDTPQGKMIDGGQTLGALLAANADMHKRIKKLEGKGKA